MNNPTTNLTPKKIQWIVWSLLSLMPIIGMAVDLISPSLPAIAHGLQAQAYTAKSAISIYLLGYALGNFITGFLADALGRQKLLRLSLLAFFIVSIMPVIFPNIEVLLLSRLLQGLTLGAVAVLNKTIFSDILPPEKIIRLGVLIGTMWGIGPIIGPIIGGYLQFYFGWQAGFYFFSVLGLISFIAIFFIIPETHANQHPLNFTTIKNNIIEVMQHRIFMSLVILMGCAYSLIIIFNTMGPFLIQNTLHYSPVFFGHIAFWMGTLFLLATLYCRYLLKIYTVEKIYFVTLNVFFFIAILSLIGSYFFDKSLTLLVATSACMYFACGFIFPMSMGKGVSLFRHISGAASAIMYLINMLITSFASFVAGFIHTQNIIPMLWLYTALLFICFLIYWKVINARRPQQDH